MLSYGTFQINGVVQPSGSCLTVGISSSQTKACSFSGIQTRQFACFQRGTLNASCADSLSLTSLTSINPNMTWFDMLLL